MPTPRVSDANGIGKHGDGGPDLRTVVSLLPTPMASDSHRGANAYSSGRPTLKGALSQAAGKGSRWGHYAAAIGQWETITGRDAPDPTEPGAAWHRWRRLVADRRAGRNPRPAGRRGTLAPPEAALRRVLSVRLVEWMMGLTSGWVSDIDMPRNAKLRILGNGVVPPQAAAAVRQLLQRTERP